MRDGVLGQAPRRRLCDDSVFACDLLRQCSKRKLMGESGSRMCGAEVKPRCDFRLKPSLIPGGAQEPK